MGYPMKYQDGIMRCIPAYHREQAERARQYMGIFQPLHIQCEEINEVICTICSYAKNIDYIYNSNNNGVFEGAIATLLYNFQDVPVEMGDIENVHRCMFLPT